MERNLYQIMQELKESTQTDGDVKYLGSISIDEEMQGTNVTIIKDIFAVTVYTPDGDTVVKYYDKSKTFLGAKNVDGKLYPSINYAKEDIDFLNEINELDETQAVSLNELEEELEKVSKALGISKKTIRQMSEAELDKAIKEKDSIDISDEDDLGLSPEQEEEKNKDALENIKGKQEIDLNMKIDDKYTLADVLGVAHGSKLIAVASHKINNNTNSTRFSCLIKSPDGEISIPENLKQVGGTHSDKNVYETNRDGSKVSKEEVQSTFAIDSPIVKNSVVTIRYGQMGYLEVGYGQMDKTSHRDVISENLETSRTYPVTREVRNEFSKSKGEYNATNKIDEIKEHEDLGCDNLTLDEADGNPNTGHTHSEEAAEMILSDEKVGKEIGDVFTYNEVKSRFETMKAKYPSMEYDELVEVTKAELLTDAEYMQEGPYRGH